MSVFPSFLLKDILLLWCLPGLHLLFLFSISCLPFQKPPCFETLKISIFMVFSPFLIFTFCEDHFDLVQNLMVHFCNSYPCFSEGFYFCFSCPFVPFYYCSCMP